MASYEERGKKIRVVVSVMDHGVRKKVSKTFLKLADAKDWALHMEVDKADNRQVIASKMLFSDYFEKWYLRFKKGEVRNATLLSYDTYHNLIAEYYPYIKLCDLTYPVLQDGLDNYAKGHAKSTVSAFMKHIKASLRDALLDEYITKDVWSRLRASGKVNDRDNFLSATEFETLQKYCYEHWRDKQYILAVLVAMETGLRIGEIMFLGKKEVFPEFNMIYVQESYSPKDPDDTQTKNTQSIRKLKITDQLSSVLAEAMQIHDPIFTIKESRIRTSFADLLVQLNIPNITFHGLRHSHVSYLLYKGLSIQYVSQRIGHANTNTTERVYTHLLKEQKVKEDKKAMEILSMSPDVPKQDKKAR